MDLTKREKEILNHLANGLQPLAIGPKLGLSPRTVELHISFLKLKLTAKTVAQAVAIGVRKKIIE